MKIKGIFCLEGFWYGDHRDKTSVAPILELANRFGNVPTLYHRCGTIEELKYSLSAWNKTSFYKKYPILYLAFHGKEGCIQVGKNDISLEELSEVLGFKATGTVIYFGSCATLYVNKRRLGKFMNDTGTLAMMGYKMDVDWLKSAAFEILLLEHLQKNPFDTQGIEKIKSELVLDCKRQIRDLDFRMEINNARRIVRKRKKKIITKVA